MNPRKYNFAMNDPFDMDADIKLVLPKLMSSINFMKSIKEFEVNNNSICLLYTSPSPRDRQKSRMPSSA